MSSPAHEIAELRKAGKLEEARTLARSSIQARPGDWYIESAYGWVLYDLVKNLIARFESGDVPPTAVSDGLETLLREYAHLSTQNRPDLLYSLLLSQACHAAKVWRGFVGFVFWGGLSFRDEDKQPFNMDGKTLPSLEMKVFYALGKGLLRHNHRPDVQDWAWSVLRKAVSKHSDDVWLRYYAAGILLKNDSAEEAFPHAVFVARKKGHDSWALALLGNCCSTQGRLPEAVACYREAILLARNPMEVVKVREELATLLWQNGDPQGAKHHAEQAVATREASEFKVSETLAMIAGLDVGQEPERSPFPDAQDKDVLRKLLQAGRVVASTKRAVVEHHNTDKGLTWVLESIDHGFPLFHNAHQDALAWEIGTVLEISLDSEGELISVLPSVEKGISGLVKDAAGRLSFVHGKDFGFVKVAGGEDVYVGKEFAPDWSSCVECDVIVRALRVRNKAKGGVLSWRAVRLTSQQ